jgi:hypothetical protein
LLKGIYGDEKRKSSYYKERVKGRPSSLFHIKMFSSIEANAGYGSNLPWADKIEIRDKRAYSSKKSLTLSTNVIRIDDNCRQGGLKGGKRFFTQTNACGI